MHIGNYKRNLLLRRGEGVCLQPSHSVKEHGVDNFHEVTHRLYNIPMELWGNKYLFFDTEPPLQDVRTCQCCPPVGTGKAAGSV